MRSHNGWLSPGEPRIVMQLKCTQKTLRFLGMGAAPLPEPNCTLLGAWHVNTAVIGRYRFLIFLNDNTLYCLVGVVSANQKNLQLTRLFRHLLAGAMLKNGVDQAHIEQVARDYVDEIVTRTDSRRVLGNLNDLFNQMCCFLQDAIDVNRPVDLPEIEEHLNRIPQRNIGGRLSVDVFKETLGAN